MNRRSLLSSAAAAIGCLFGGRAVAGSDGSIEYHRRAFNEGVVRNPPPEYGLTGSINYTIEPYERKHDPIDDRFDTPRHEQEQHGPVLDVCIRVVFGWMGRREFHGYCTNSAAHPDIWKRFQGSYALTEQDAADAEARNTAEFFNAGGHLRVANNKLADGPGSYPAYRYMLVSQGASGVVLHPKGATEIARRALNNPHAGFFIFPQEIDSHCNKLWEFRPALHV